MSRRRSLLSRLRLALPACASGIGSLARVTVIDRTANRELPVHWKDGRAYIAGQPGNEYAVRVRNVAGEDLLAVVSVVTDGDTESEDYFSAGVYVAAETYHRGWWVDLGAVYDISSVVFVGSNEYLASPDYATMGRLKASASETLPMCGGDVWPTIGSPVDGDWTYTARSAGDTTTVAGWQVPNPGGTFPWWKLYSFASTAETMRGRYVMVAEQWTQGGLLGQGRFHCYEIIVGGCPV